MAIDIIKYLRVPYKHLGRDFYGVDCMGLVKLLYEEEYGVSLGDIPEYSENWAEEGSDYLSDNVEGYGFYQVDDPRPGDVVMFSRRGKLVHVGVIIDVDNFIHTTRKGTAVHSLFCSEWTEKLGKIVRHRKVLNDS